MTPIDEEKIKRYSQEALEIAAEIITWLDTSHGIQSHIKKLIRDFKMQINEIKRVRDEK